MIVPASNDAATLTRLLRCPACRSPGQMDVAAWVCGGCSVRWPMELGIVDFRRSAHARDDLSFAHAGTTDDRRARLVAAFTDASFAELARLYFSLFETTAEIRERECATLSDSLGLADDWLFQIEQVVPLAELGREGGTAVDVGCGGGGLAVALARRGLAVIGLDADFERLILAKKHAAENGVDVLLAAAEAESLPLAEGSAAFVSCLEVLEHVSDQPAAVRELRRVLAPGGHLYLTTPNRFSIGREPHVRLRAMGFLPRSWMDPYVRMRLGVRYTGKRNPSLWELGRLFGGAFGASWRVVRPRRRHYTFQGRLASVLWQMPILRSLAQAFGAGFHVSARGG